MEKTKQDINNSQNAAAKEEIEHAISLISKNIQRSINTLSQWQEVRQQLENPEIFAYWFNVRLKKSAFEFQKYTSDLMIYNIKGQALAKLDDSSLPFTIKTNNIKSTTYRIINDKEIIYTQPVFNNNVDKEIIGHLSAQLEILPLLKSLTLFHYIEIDSLKLNNINNKQTFNTFTENIFKYELRKTKGIILLEQQMHSSLINLVIIILIPTLLLYLAIIYIVGMPMKAVERHIDTLRTNPKQAQRNEVTSYLQIRELKSVYDSLNNYHTELTQKEEHLSLTLNSIGDAVIATNGTSNIIRMNPIAEKLTGWTIKEATGKHIQEVFNIIDTHTRKRIDNPFVRTLIHGETIHLNKDITLISKNKKEYYISDSAAPIRDTENIIRGIVLVFNDISEQKLKDEQLQHSLKMDALGKLTGGIAHDFNNLLGVILGYSELLTQKLSDQPALLNYTDQIYNAGERARKLTTKLLGFSKKQSHQLSTIDINKLLISEQHMLEKTLTARIELSFDFKTTLWPVHIDDNLLQDAVLNICINAMHAMPEGGSLKITTENIHFDKIDQKHIELDAGDYVQVSISDSGTGMDSETKQKIFDPFFTTKGEKGTGLGMSQVYGFVQLSGGALHVYSELGIGTRISIYLPRHHPLENELEENSETETNLKKIPFGDESILVVDDESALLELSSQILTSHGYTVFKANSGVEALSILKQQRIDLLLTDVIMPKMNGLQLSEAVSSTYPRIKIQLISGFNDNMKSSNQEALLSNQLNKPFSSLQLLQTIRKALDS